MMAFCIYDGILHAWDILNRIELVRQIANCLGETVVAQMARPRLLQHWQPLLQTATVSQSTRSLQHHQSAMHIQE